MSAAAPSASTTASAPPQTSGIRFSQEHRPLEPRRLGTASLGGRSRSRSCCPHRPAVPVPRPAFLALCGARGLWLGQLLPDGSPHWEVTAPSRVLEQNIPSSTEDSGVPVHVSCRV